MKNNLFEGFKFGVGIILAFTLLFSIYAAGWHTAGEILGGTFLGNYIFNGTVEFKNDVTVGNLISDNITLSPAKTQTIYFDSSMTAQDIQNIINNVSKYIPYGRVITFQFKDGTYNLNQTLYFNGFYGGGYLYIFGNTTETDSTNLHTTQRVFLDFSSQNINGLEISDNDVTIFIYNFKVKVDTSTGWSNAIFSIRNSRYILTRYNYLFGTSTSYGRGVGHYNSGAIGYVFRNYVSNVARGIECTLSRCYSRENDDTGTMPGYGLFATGSGTIGKYLTQPSGSTANEYIGSGGEIR